MENNFEYDFKVSPIFQQRLLDLVIESQISRTKLPSLMGVSQDIMVRALNAGLIPSTKSLIKITDFFSVSIEYLLGFTDQDTFEKSELPSTFFERVNKLKTDKNVSYYEIAKKLGFAKSLFFAWEKYNYVPSLEITYLLSRYFNVSMDYLLGRTDDKKN